MNSAVASETAQAVLRLDGVARSYEQGDLKVEVFKSASLELARGERVGLVGPSGAGKSSLLHIAGLLEAPDGGDVIINGASCGRLSENRRTAIRRIEIGFVYQFHHLLPEFTALENVVMPQRIAGQDRSTARTRAADLLERLGLKDRMVHRPAELSGGEQQRVAIARAVANSPGVLLADEPTGNLDPSTAGEVYEQLTRLIEEEGLSMLIATHNLELAKQMDRVIRLEDGELVAA